MLQAPHTVWHIVSNLLFLLGLLFLIISDYYIFLIILIIK